MKAPSVDAGPLRPRDRSQQPLADDPRVDRSRHRARPRTRIRGELRRHVVCYPRQARINLKYGSDLMHVTGDRTVEARVGKRRLGRRRRRRRKQFDIVKRWVARRIPARPADRLAGRIRPLQRLRVRRLPRSRTHSANGQCRPATDALMDRTPKTQIAGRRRWHLHRWRQELVDRHAALQLPVHRSALLPDQERTAHAAKSRMSPTRPQPLTSGAPWLPSAARRRTCCRAPSTAARPSPVRSLP